MHILPKIASGKALSALGACIFALTLSACNLDGLPPEISAPAALVPVATANTAVSTQVVPTATSSAEVEGDYLEIDPDYVLRDGAQPVPVGQPAPDFTLPGIDAKTYTLSSMKGSVVVLEFMATWCPYCQAQAPKFTQLHDNYASKDVQVLGINATPFGHNYESGDRSAANTDDLTWFRDNFKISYPLLFDTTLQSAFDYGVMAYPAAYIIDKDGNVAFQPSTDSQPNYDTLASIIDSLLK